MTKSVTVAELAEHLQDHLAEVERGTTIEVVANDHTIATISPPVTEPERPRKRLGDFRPSPRPKTLTIDPVEVLLEERERRRSGEKYK